MTAPYTPLLATLDYVRRHRGLKPTETEDDDLLLQFLGEASVEFAEAVERLPMPYQAARAQDWCDPTWLPLDDDLLALTALTNGDGLEITAGDLLLEPANGYPKRELMVKRSAAARLSYSGEPSQAISVTGIWGYVTHYPSAWKPLTSLSVALSDGIGLTVGLTSVSGIEIGQYLKAEDEVLGYVTAIDTDAKTATVDERGALGTTPVEHGGSATVAAFRQRPDIAGAVREIAVYKYKAKDRIGGRVTVIDHGVVTVEDLDPSVQATVDRIRRNYWVTP